MFDFNRLHLPFQPWVGAFPFSSLLPDPELSLARKLDKHDHEYIIAVTSPHLIFSLLHPSARALRAAVRIRPSSRFC